MTPSVAASATGVTAALLASGSTAVHDREWWAEEAVHAGTDWYGVVTAALEMLVTAGILELPESESLTHWGAPSWREASSITAIGGAASPSRSSPSGLHACAR